MRLITAKARRSEAVEDRWPSRPLDNYMVAAPYLLTDSGGWQAKTAAFALNVMTGALCCQVSKRRATSVDRIADA